MRDKRAMNETIAAYSLVEETDGFIESETSTLYPQLSGNIMTRSISSIPVSAMSTVYCFAHKQNNYGNICTSKVWEEQTSGSVSVCASIENEI